jgi:hypothetical protein
MILYAVADDALSPDFPLGVELEVFIRREDAERFVEEVRGDDPELARLPPCCRAGAASGSAAAAPLTRLLENDHRTSGFPSQRSSDWIRCSRQNFAKWSISEPAA